MRAINGAILFECCGVEEGGSFYFAWNAAGLDLVKLSWCCRRRILVEKKDEQDGAFSSSRSIPLLTALPLALFQFPFFTIAHSLPFSWTTSSNATTMGLGPYSHNHSIPEWNNRNHPSTPLIIVYLRTIACNLVTPTSKISRKSYWATEQVAFLPVVSTNDLIATLRIFIRPDNQHENHVFFTTGKWCRNQR